MKEIHELDKIWERLKLSYGNVEILLTNKLGEMENSSPLWKIKDDEKLVQSITKLKNCLTDLKSMAKIHKIENSLFHTSNLAKIFQLIGRQRQSKITKKSLNQV